MRLAVFFSLVLISSFSFGLTPCESALSSIVSADQSWRASFAHPLADGSFLRSDSKREKDIQNSLQHQNKELQGVYSGKPETPPMVVVPTTGTKIRFTKAWEEYSPMIAEVTGASDGFLNASVLLPVSGHTGLANAYNWAKTDTYTLTYDNGSGKEIDIVKDAKSKDLITVQDIKIPLVDGKPVILRYYRSGSGGPSGYSGGRELHLTWQKNKVDNTPFDFSQPFW